jgi:PEP-CTERM motif
MSAVGLVGGRRNEETMNRTKIGILGLSALLMLSVASVSASASALPSGISDRMTIAGSNGGANNCTGNSIVDILEGPGGKDTYKNGVSAVVCNGKYGFGPVEGGSQRDFLQYAVTGKMRSDSGPETGIDPGEADSIIITITAFSYPDGSPLSDLLTVTVKDSMGLYNYAMSVPIFELSNGNDSPGVVTVNLATLTGGFHSFTGDCCDSVSLSGVIRLQSIPGPLNGDPGTLESTTQVIRIGAYSDATPEPSTLLLLGTGLAGIAGIVRRRKSK